MHRKLLTPARRRFMRCESQTPSLPTTSSQPSVSFLLRVTSSLLRNVTLFHLLNTICLLCFHISSCRFLCRIGVVLNRHEGELRSSSYWAMMMSGLQEESIPLKGPLSMTDFHAVVDAITTKDLQLTLECLGLDDKELYTAIGKTVQPEGVVQDEVVKASPMAGMSRGGALMAKSREY
mmetsp:Transcript_10219/g.20459  ORF Transcript_10219/g.20459 Transcript_10219/m.20459 type:complete len:178 (-) Transcript_10219:284-817(-)